MDGIDGSIPADWSEGKVEALRERIAQACRRARDLRDEARAVIERVEERQRSIRRTTDHPTVLVVDDEHAVRVMVGRLLSDAGYRVVLARSGEEALEALAQQPRFVDLLLSDLRMPQMDGIHLATAIRRRRPHTRVLLMTAYPSDDVLGWPLLLKPFTSGALESEVRRVLTEPVAG
jgi:CheY-like chemotaxis protein